MNKKTTITNLVGMKQEVEFTELEQELIGVIDNFILWNTTESDIGLAEEYMANEHVDYNEFFKINKSKYNREDKIMDKKEISNALEETIDSLNIYYDSIDYAEGKIIINDAIDTMRSVQRAVKQMVIVNIKMEDNR